jgi:hypothetical protein
VEPRCSHNKEEDQGLFPQLQSHAPLAATIAQLMADHRRIDPLLDEGDLAFARLPNTEPALKVIAELKALLDAHLATEEAEVVPFLRGVQAFPPPASNAEAELYSEGFAWSSHGVAPEVLEQAMPCCRRACVRGCLLRAPRSPHAVKASGGLL